MVGVLVIHRIPNTCIGCQFNDIGECYAKPEHRFIEDEDLDEKTFVVSYKKDTR